MEIRPNANIDSVARVVTTNGKASRPVSAEPETPAFESSRALEARLGDYPDVRPEKVEQGKHLVGDPQYPPRETIRKIATLLALSEQKTGNEIDPSALG